MRQSYFQYTIHGPGKSFADKEMKPSSFEDGCKAKKVIWAVYPHGILPWTAIFFWGLNPAFDDVVPCIHGMMFKIPLIREMAGWMGCTSVDSKDMLNALQTHGKSCCSATKRNLVY